MFQTLIFLLSPIVALESHRCTNISDWGPVIKTKSRIISWRDSPADADADMIPRWPGRSWSLAASPPWPVATRFARKSRRSFVKTFKRSNALSRLWKSAGDEVGGEGIGFRMIYIWWLSLWLQFLKSSDVDDELVINLHQFKGWRIVRSTCFGPIRGKWLLKQKIVRWRHLPL